MIRRTTWKNPMVSDEASDSHTQSSKLVKATVPTGWDADPFEADPEDAPAERRGGCGGAAGCPCWVTLCITIGASHSARRARDVSLKFTFI